MISKLVRFTAILGLSVTLFGDTPMTRLKVKVTTLSGKPVDRASVIVDFVEGRSIVKLGKKIITHWEVRTNQEGLAKVPELPQGTITVRVIAKGFQTFGEKIDVGEEDKTVDIKLNPPQQQYSAHQ